MKLRPPWARHMANLHISPQAQKDLLDIKEYITEELGNPTAALNVLEKITKRIRELSDYPELGVSLDSIIEIKTDYRFLVCGNYTAFYRYSENTVYVNRVLYGRRDFIKVLFGELP